jgi:hypothetical protein
LQCLRGLAIVYDFVRVCDIDGTAFVYTLTYLELNTYDYFHDVDDPDTPELAARIGRLTQLTHIAFNSTVPNNTFYATLRAHSRTQCIVCLYLKFPEHAADSEDTDITLREDWLRWTRSQITGLWQTHSSRRGAPEMLIVSLAPTFLCHSFKCS